MGRDLGRGVSLESSKNVQKVESTFAKLDSSARVDSMDCHATASALVCNDSLLDSNEALSPSSRAFEKGEVIQSNQSRGTRNLESVQGVWGFKGDKGGRFASSSPVPLEKNLSQTTLESSKKTQKVESTMDCHADKSARNDRKIDSSALVCNDSLLDSNEAPSPSSRALREQSAAIHNTNADSSDETIDCHAQDSRAFTQALSQEALHIFFNSSTPYLKYLAVLLHSIVSHTDSSDRTPYVFHILLDSRGFDPSSGDELGKLEKLESQLSSMHPCGILTHDCATLLDTISTPINATRVIYSRLFLQHFVPANVQKALYLDVDMLVIADIRAIFVHNLGEFCIGAVKDVVQDPAPLPARDGISAPYCFSKAHRYFNSGMLLINLPKWRQERIEQRCVAFLNTYCAYCFDQDALNAVLAGAYLHLDLCWNLQTQFYNQYRSYEYAIANALKRANPLAQSFAARKIIHYVCEPKPWHSPYLALDSTHLPMFGYERATWWDLARRTQGFEKELKELESSLLSNALEAYAHALSSDLQAMQLRVDKIIALLKNPLGFAYRTLSAKVARLFTRI